MGYSNWISCTNSSLISRNLHLNVCSVCWELAQSVVYTNFETFAGKFGDLLITLRGQLQTTLPHNNTAAHARCWDKTWYVLLGCYGDWGRLGDLISVNWVDFTVSYGWINFFTLIWGGTWSRGWILSRRGECTNRLPFLLSWKIFKIVINWMKLY